MSSRKCMSIDAIIINPTKAEVPPSPPESTIGAPSSPPPSPIMTHHHAPTKSVAGATTAERRYRNKIASAKYRAKKQENMRSMAAKLAQMSSKNATLQRQLTQALEDNDALRHLCKSLMAATATSPTTCTTSPSSA